MDGRRHEGSRGCGYDHTDVTCAGLAVGRLTQERVRELAEEIWTMSTGMVPARPIRDPRGSQAGAAAQAAYRRRRQQELEAWRPGWRWRAVAVASVAVAAGLLVGLTMGTGLGWRAALLVALLGGWRLRFRASSSATVWRRQAIAQRRTAAALQPLEQEGYLVLHDVTLPGRSESIDHLLVGPTGVWVIESKRRGRAALLDIVSQRRGHGGTNGALRALRSEAAAVADALGGGASIPVKPLLCIYGRTPPRGRRSVEGVRTAAPRRLAEIVRQGSPLGPDDVERATSRALEVLRPAV
jgi:Nuclease-related domain